MTAQLWTPGEKPADSRFIDLEGQNFGKLRVAQYVGRGNRGEHMWRCDCACGAETVARGSHLRQAAILSCGCHRSAATTSNKERHGHARKHSKSPTYRSWINMRERCYRTTNNRYHLYGGRGIRVCQRWLTGENGLSAYECFLADMGERPSGEHSIDRIDCDGNYEPANCRWASRSEQVRNRRAFTIKRGSADGRA